MNIDDASGVVGRYYLAYRAGSSAEVAEALAAVLAPTFTLDSPLVQDRLGAPASGAAATAMAVQAAAVLQRADVTALYFTADSTGVVALIRFPTPAGTVWQSEHFDIDPAAGTILSLRSYYDPRKLLRSPPGQD